MIAVARNGEAPLAQIVRDFGISESCLHPWLKHADIGDVAQPGASRQDSALRVAKKRIRQLEQEAEVMRRAVAYLSRDVNPK